MCSTSTHTLRMSILLLSHTIAHFNNFSPQLQKHLPLGHKSTLQCCVLLWGFSLSFLFLGDILAPGLSSLFQDGICDGSTTFLDSSHHLFHLSLSPSSIDWATQAESNISCITKRKPLFERLLTKKKRLPPHGPRPLFL